MRKNITRVLFGVVLVIAAVVVFGNSLGLWDFTNFSGWWTVFLIVPGLAGLIGYGFNVGSTCLVVVGTWLLARAQGWISSRVADSMVLVVILLLIGFRLIFGSFHRRRMPGGPVIMEGIKGANDTSNTVSYTALFGSVEVSNNSPSLCGGNVSAVFGGATVDLRQAVPVDGAVLEINAVFGGVKIFAPVSCRLQVTGMPFLGGCECTAQRSNDPSLPLLIIRYTAAFGGTEIR
ncbi:MAG: cell wall-active antibiotics response protein [Clostridiales bacterium]|jgi:predicted membrane protein|nr:cell wall-active antibiotics response protein [Clostridiales bacterium]